MQLIISTRQTADEFIRCEHKHQCSVLKITFVTHMFLLI